MRTNKRKRGGRRGKRGAGYRPAEGEEEEAEEKGCATEFSEGGLVGNLPPRVQV